MKSICTYIVLLATTGVLGGCGAASMTWRNNSSNNNLGCTLSGPPAVTATGLSGSLYYLPAGSPNLNSVNDYINPAYLDPNPVYLSDVNVPTRLNTQGFPDLFGNLLETTLGVTLTTNFALDMQSTLVLSPSQSAGNYQFAILSDDGALLDYVDSGGNSHNIVSGDGLHPTTFSCGSQAVFMAAQAQLNINLKYYQGPANEIALVMLWRQVPSGKAPVMTYCGDSGNNTFFDPTTHAPQTEYNNILALGWKPIPSANYLMPQPSAGNCQ